MITALQRLWRRTPHPKIEAKYNQVLELAYRQGYENPTEEDADEPDERVTVYALENELCDLMFLVFEAGYEAAMYQSGDHQHVSPVVANEEPRCLGGCAESP